MLANEQTGSSERERKRWKQTGLTDYKYVVDKWLPVRGYSSVCVWTSHCEIRLIRDSFQRQTPYIINANRTDVGSRVININCTFSRNERVQVRRSYALERVVYTVIRFTIVSVPRPHPYVWPLPHYRFLSDRPTRIFSKYIFAAVFFKKNFIRLFLNPDALVYGQPSPRAVSIYSRHSRAFIN